MQFTSQEIEILKQMIHIAVMARGMEVAEAGVALTRKIDVMIRLAQAQERQAQLKNVNQPAAVPAGAEGDGGGS